ERRVALLEYEGHALDAATQPFGGKEELALVGPLATHVNRPTAAAPPAAHATRRVGVVVAADGDQQQAGENGGGGGHEPAPPRGRSRLHWGPHPCTALIMSKIGRYMATIMPPTTTPSTTIMIGSIAARSASTAESTSSS